MCDNANPPLGKTSASRPSNGNQKQGDSAASCPNTEEKATIVVYIYHGPSTDGIDGIPVKLSGPKSDSGDTVGGGTKSFVELPAGSYSASIDAEQVEAYKGARVEAVADTLTLKPGEKKDMKFRVHPAQVDLTVSVVRPNAEGGQVISDEQFDVQLSGGSNEKLTAPHGIAKTAKVELGKEYGATLVLTARQQALYKPAGPAPAKLTIQRGGANVIKIPLALRVLKLTQVDDHFAPSKEELEVKYEIRNLEKEPVELRIEDCAGQVVYRRNLDNAKGEDKDGSRVLRWGKEDSDKVDCPGHPLHGRFINPLFGPYKVVLAHPITTTHLHEEDHALTFNVLYDSIAIELMPWKDLYLAASGRTDDTFPAGAGDDIKRMWAQYKLNALGFWAGPIDGKADNEDFRKGVRRFRVAHPSLSGWGSAQLMYEAERTHGSTLERWLGPKANRLMDTDDEFYRVLKEEGARPGRVKALNDYGRTGVEDSKAFGNKGKDTRIFIDSHRFSVAEGSEFESASQHPEIKFQCEEAWLSQPHIPVRARIKIRHKNGPPAEVPAATGKAPVLWTWEDVSEAELRAANLAPALPSYSIAQPSRTLDYVGETQRKLKRGRKHGVPADAGGLITGNDDQDDTTVFKKCDALDATDYAVADLPPGPDAPAPMKGVLARAYDGDQARKTILGTSVVYLCPSTIGGDSYKVTARLFLGAGPNPKQLVEAHPHAPMKAESGRLVVWRRIRLAAFVQWPVRRRVRWPADAPFDVGAQFNLVKAEFERCFVDFQTDVRADYSIDNVIASDDFIKLIKDADKANSLDKRIQDHLIPAGGPALPMSPDGLYPGDAERCGPHPTFQAVANRLFRRDFLANGAGSQAPKLADFNAAMKIASAWQGGATDRVRRAGAHFRDQLLAHCLDQPDPAVESWALRADAARDRVQALGANLAGAPPLAADTDITPEELADFFLPNRLKDELNAYVAGTGDSAVFAADFRLWIGKAVDKRKPELRTADPGGGSHLETYYEETVLWLMEMILPANATRFKAGVPTNVRAYLLDLRQWTVAKIHSLAETIKTKLSWLIDEKARKTLADAGKATDGAVVFDFAAHKPVQLGGVDYVVEACAFGGTNGVAMISQGMISKFDSLVAHELAHCMFLQHWTNASGNNPHLHDESDDNCLMSYPYNKPSSSYNADEHRYYVEVTRHFERTSARRHYSVDLFTPHFCGKCNLQLRGWKITGAPLPTRSLRVTTPPPVKPVQVRLVATQAGQAVPGAAPAREFLGDSAQPSLGLANAIGISCYPSDKAGSQTAKFSEFTLGALSKFPEGFGDNPDAEKDPAAFRVEVEDPNLEGQGIKVVKVMIEALKPVYDQQGKPTGAVEEFPPAERAKRCLVGVECEKVSDKDDEHRYRSRYLRLVTDEVDRIALAPTKQGLLVTDMADGQGGANDLIEILDQQVRVTYDPTPP